MTNLFVNDLGTHVIETVAGFERVRADGDPSNGGVAPEFAGKALYATDGCAGGRDRMQVRCRVRWRQRQKLWLRELDGLDISAHVRAI